MQQNMNLILIITAKPGMNCNNTETTLLLQLLQFFGSAQELTEICEIASSKFN